MNPSTLPIAELFPSHSRLYDRDFMNLKSGMDNLMSDLFTLNSFKSPGMETIGFIPSVDIKEKDNMYYLEAELPGMTENEVEIDLHDNILTIKGEKKMVSKEQKDGFFHSERAFGTFRRYIPFSAQINPDKIKAQLKDGVLQVELEKKESIRNVHRNIKIKT